MTKRFHEVYKDGVLIHSQEIVLTPEQELGQILENRKADYPPIGDQLDVIWKELNRRKAAGDVLNAETDAMLSKILGVKALYPKPKEV